MSKSTPIARTLRKNDTWAERLLWSWLRHRRFSVYKFRRQHPFGPYILDFFCVEAFLNIELDGGQHGFPEHRQKDIERDAWLEARGVKVLRFWNSRLRREQEAIRNTIWQALQERAPQPMPDYCRTEVNGSAKRDEAVMVAESAGAPHPSPLPWGEGESLAALAQSKAFAASTVASESGRRERV